MRLLTIKSKEKPLALDNAGKIYPAAKTKNWNAVFGVSVIMKNEINVSALKSAVEELTPRFPSMYVKLKNAFFWDCLEKATDFDIVEKELDCPCRPMQMENTNKPLFRVVYNERKIRVEFSHSVTDGTGAFEYLKALVLQYVKNCGKKIEKTDGVKTTNDFYKLAEIKDEFQNVYEKGNRCSRKDTDAYQVQLNKEENYLGESSICIPINELKTVSKERYNCTVTQYVATVYALALLNNFRKNNDTQSQKKTVKLSIPVNLRKYWQSETLRNFASYITINVTPEKDYTFNNVLELVKSGMEEKITKEKMFKNVCQNVADEKMVIAKYSPNGIKKIFMKNAFHMFGERKYTSTVTSIGYIKLPQSLENEVQYMMATLGETSLNKINCAVVGFKNTLCVNISSCSKNKEIENFFMNYVKSQGISAKLNTNFNNYELTEVETLVG